MLDSLRGFAKSWPGKVMGAFLLVGVAGFGINNVITDLGSNTVARVGGEEITSREFLRAYQGQMSQAAQQLGRMPTAEEAMNLGIPGQVLEGLAQNAALNQMASNFGLGVSSDTLSEMLRDDPSFYGTLGVFDRNAFTQVLRASGLTEAEYFDIQADSARRNQLVLSLFADTTLPAAAAELINGYVNDQRSIEYFALGPLNIATPAEPTEEELAAYLSEHQVQFRTVETRQVQMLRLTVADLAATKTIPDEAIAAEYERTKANLTTPEKRTISQVVLTDDQVAAFEAGKAAGKSFDTLVAEAGLTPTDLGTLAQADITDAGLASAAFGLAEGDFVIVPGATGQRAVHVSAIEPTGTPTLEEARDQIAQSLAQVEARNELADVQDQIEELRAAFRPLTEIAERFGLDLYEANVTSGGTELSVVPDLAADDQTRIRQAVFKAEQGGLTAAIPLAGSGNLWFDLLAVEPARDQTLDEVRDQVSEALTEERTNEALMAESEAAVARLDAGEALTDIATGYGVLPQISVPFSRFGSEDGTVDSTVASAVFAGGPDHHGSVVSQTGDFLVFAVTDATPASTPLDEQAMAALGNEYRNGIGGEFVMGLRQQAGLKINEQAFQQALALNGGL